MRWPRVQAFTFYCGKFQTYTKKRWWQNEFPCGLHLVPAFINSIHRRFNGTQDTHPHGQALGSRKLHFRMRVCQLLCPLDLKITYARNTVSPLTCNGSHCFRGSEPMYMTASPKSYSQMPAPSVSVPILQRITILISLSMTEPRKMELAM